MCVCVEEPNSDGTKDQNTPPDIRTRSLGDEVGLVNSCHVLPDDVLRIE